MSKKNPGKRSTTHVCHPSDLVLIRDPTHFLYQERVNREITPEEVEAIRQARTILDCARIPGYDKPVVVAGRGRLIAARAAGLTEIEYKLHKGSPRELAEIMVQENALHRTLTPLEKAHDAQRLMGLGASIEEVAVTFGQTVQSIKNYVKVLGFHPDMVKAIEANRISLDKALTEFRAIPEEEQPAKLKEWKEANPVNPETGKPKQKKRRPKGHKDIVAFMAGDEGTSLSERDWVFLQWSQGLATDAEAVKLLGNTFKKSLARAKRAIKKQEAEAEAE